MFVDASAIIAILRREPGFEELEKRLAAADGPFAVSPLVRFEATVSLARLKSLPAKPTGDLLQKSQEAVAAFIEAIEAEEVPIGSEIGRKAIAASLAYGKSVGHPASLNFGDCFAYACAKALNVPLLYKGNDFALTDLG